jgi:holliday junction DNA helicase RuvB
MNDYLFANRPRYLLVDEIDKMSPRDHAFLLNLMETGTVSETKYSKTRTMYIQTSVFATSNHARKMSAPLQSRFFIVKLEAYTYEQFCEITKQVISRQKVEGQNKSQDVRDCVRVGTLAKSTKDVEFIVNKFFGSKTRQVEIQT